MSAVAPSRAERALLVPRAARARLRSALAREVKWNGEVGTVFYEAGDGEPVENTEALSRELVLYMTIGIFIGGIVLFVLFYFLTLYLLRRRARARARVARRREGTFAVAMEAPPETLFAWLESHGVSKAQLDKLCPETVQAGAERSASRAGSDAWSRGAGTDASDARCGSEDGDGVCVVCIEAIERGERRRCLPCAHVFHSRCIEVWLGKANRCPVCNKALEFPGAEEDGWTLRRVRQLGRVRRPMELVDNDAPGGSLLLSAHA